MSSIKKLNELTIRDNFLFAAVMQQGDNCKRFLEMLLGIKVERVHILYEKSIIYNPEYKGIRMDVYASDERNTCYNIEMQVVRDALPKRSRYYHSQIDMELLDSGEDYENLPDSYVIFICDFDPFGEEKYCYSFESLCLENKSLYLADGSRSIFLSTKGKNPEEISKELMYFLTIIGEHEPGKSKDYQDAYVEQLQKSIRKVKQSREMGSKYMSLQLMLRDEYRKGKAEGMAEGMAESIILLLESKGLMTEKLRQRIGEETDLTVLADMLKAAAKAEAPEQFEENMSQGKQART